MKSWEPGEQMHAICVMKWSLAFQPMPVFHPKHHYHVVQKKAIIDVHYYLAKEHILNLTGNANEMTYTLYWGMCMIITDLGQLYTLGNNAVFLYCTPKVVTSSTKTWWPALLARHNSLEEQRKRAVMNGIVSVQKKKKDCISCLRLHSYPLI